MGSGVLIWRDIILPNPPLSHFLPGCHWLGTLLLFAIFSLETVNYELNPLKPWPKKVLVWVCQIFCLSNKYQWFELIKSNIFSLFYVINSNRGKQIEEWHEAQYLVYTRQAFYHLSTTITLLETIFLDIVSLRYPGSLILVNLQLELPKNLQMCTNHSQKVPLLVKYPFTTDSVPQNTSYSAKAGTFTTQSDLCKHDKSPLFSLSVSWNSMLHEIRSPLYWLPNETGNITSTSFHLFSNSLSTSILYFLVLWIHAPSKF